MSPDLLVPIGIAGVAVLAAIAAFLVAWRRSSGAEWKRRVQRETLSADRSLPVDLAESPAVDEPEPEPVAADAAPVGGGTAIAVEHAQRVVEVSPEEAGISRRMFFNRALGYIFLGGFGGTLALSILSFMWPKVTGGFGADVRAGKAEDLLAQTANVDGSVTPVFIPEARAYIVPAPSKISAQFEGKGVTVDGIFALYQRCVHLGCRVPWCQTSQGFECPCHGSKYNEVGEYFAGPAPRNLDRFVIDVDPTGELIIKTGTIIQTPRAIDKSVDYPKGVQCIGAVAE
jgi:cytochrome b6-f complex iron-sulfur subunit